MQFEDKNYEVKLEVEERALRKYYFVSEVPLTGNADVAGGGGGGGNGDDHVTASAGLGFRITTPSPLYSEWRKCC